MCKKITVQEKIDLINKAIKGRIIKQNPNFEDFLKSDIGSAMINLVIGVSLPRTRLGEKAEDFAQEMRLRSISDLAKVRRRSINEEANG